MTEKRSFKVESVMTTKGCPTKFNHDSRYISKTPVGAAKKAHTYLCNRKNIRGSCTLVITVSETTRDSNNKEFTYKVTRRRLKEPVVLANGARFDYETKAHKHSKLARGKSCKQSRGKMRKHSVKHHKHRRDGHKHSKRHSRKHSRK